LNDEHWDPQTLSPAMARKVPETKLLLDSKGVEFGQSKPLLVDIPLEKVGKAHG
jgi:hypothetical protein